MTEIVPSVSPGASPFDALRQIDSAGREYWSGRDLMRPFGYSKWERFEVAIERARAAIANSGQNPEDHASRVLEASGRTGRADYCLSRFGAYLVAMNGDPRKPEIAAAQTYFAVKTREAETRPAVPVEKPLDELEVAERYVAALRKNRELTARVGLEAARADAEHAARKQLEPLAAAGRAFTDITGTVSVAVAAGHLSNDLNIKVGRDRLFLRMRDLGWICREGRSNRKYWRAKQNALDTGYLAEVPNPYVDPETGGLKHGEPTIRITSKGLRRLYFSYYEDGQGAIWEDAG